ncbi:MAG: Crp/Fnr family transcriptional regulator [Clostridiales bacterium]|nr:Crp/Fnr family transcriptional regulator [Clostridiales bacterium]
MSECSHTHHHFTCLAVVPIFQGLSDQERLQIARAASSRRYSKGEYIYRAGDTSNTLYVLHEGQVKLTRLHVTGREQVLRVLGPGDFFGELALFSSLPHTDSAQALGPVTMCALDGAALKQLMGRQPSIAFQVMDALSQRLEQADGLLEAVSLSSVTQRLAGMLLSLSDGRAAFTLPMSKGDFASQLGMSQETLSRRLTALQEEGLLSLSGHRGIRILDRAALEALSLEGE